MTTIPPRILVVAVDRLPAWILPPYGATWVSMPALTALAGRGLVFDRAIATNDDPARSLAEIVGPPSAAVHGSAMLVTDDAPSAASHRGRSTVVTCREGPRVAAAEAETDLARLFAAAAAAVADGTAGVVVVQATSLGRSWDAPEELRAAHRDPDDPPPPPGAAVPDLEVTAATDPDLLVAIRHVFAGQLMLLDRCLGRLLAAVDAAGGAWTILVAGLRGMPLGLHGRVGRGDPAPFSELVHLPVVLVDAAGRMAAQRYGGLVTPADLGATLGELAAVPQPDAAEEPWRGRSLVGLLERWQTRDRDRVIVVASTGTAVVTDAWHAVLPTGADRPRLHAKPDDFFELCDVADRSAAEAEELGRLAAAAAAGDVARAWHEPLTPAAGGVTGPKDVGFPV